MGQKLTRKDFIRKATNVHGNKYDYSKTEYKGSRYKVNIICPEHGIFEQNASHHIHRNHGCPKCSCTKKLTIEEFINNAKQIHGDKYDYSLVDYKNAKTKVTIICPEHGEFEQTPSSHVDQKTGCPKCSNKYKYSTVEFITKAKSIHDKRYNYSKVNYINNYTPITIICPKHGEFEQTPSNHLSGKGCNLCRSSINENVISLFLENHNIDYHREYRFDKCRHKRKLPFDFYLPELNICIEYNGIQHYKPIEFFGGEENFVEQLKRDKIKKKFCKRNNIELITLKYNSDIITNLTKKLLIG